MPSGRTPDQAERNRQIIMAYTDGVPPRVIADIWNVSRKTVHKIVSDPASTKVTLRLAAPLVRRIDSAGLEDGIAHGSVSGYRSCLRRDAGACGDCRTANALAQSRYQASKRISP